MRPAALLLAAAALLASPAAASIHAYDKEYFYSVGDAYIFRGGREGLYASTKEVSARKDGGACKRVRAALRPRRPPKRARAQGGVDRGRNWGGGPRGRGAGGQLPPLAHRVFRSAASVCVRAPLPSPPLVPTQQGWQRRRKCASVGEKGRGEERGRRGGGAPKDGRPRHAFTQSS